MLNKHFHALNFVYAECCAEGKLSVGGRGLVLDIISSADDIHHITVSDPRLPGKNTYMERLAPLCHDRERGNGAGIEVTADAGMRLRAPGGEVLLEGNPGNWFGRSGAAWLFQFRREADMCFYGLGEKQAPFERGGRTYGFRNVDVWADHPLEQVREGDYDPDYISIPYLIIKRGNTYIGLLADTPIPRSSPSPARPGWRNSCGSGWIIRPPW